MGKYIIGYILILLCVLLLGLPVFAEEYSVGEVLYHQNFSAVSSASVTGIHKGTASSPDSLLLIQDSALGLVTTDDFRTYALLPEIPWTESYTIEFDFRFGDARSSRGYLAFLLTCWGEEPSNITSLVIRANGSIDDFEPLSEEIAEKIQTRQDTIHVEIPIANGILHEVTLSAGDAECTVRRDSLKRITEGSRGFGIRNVSAEINEIYIVNGTGYSAKKGTFAEASWSDDPDNVPVGEAPPTGEPIGLLGMAVCCAGMMVWSKRTKRHIKN